MNYQKEEFESKNLDHLGIIAEIIDEIEIVEKINEIFLVDSRLNNSFPDILRRYIEGIPILWDGHTMANATLRYRQAQYKSCPSLIISGQGARTTKNFWVFF